MSDKKVELMDVAEIDVKEIAKKAYDIMNKGTTTDDNDIVSYALYAGCKAGVIEAIKTIYKIELDGEKN